MPITLILTAALLILGGGTTLAAPPLQQGGAAPIRLQAGTFNPGQGQAPNLPPGLTIAGYAQNQTGYYIVQFQGPVEQSWKNDVAAQGAELLNYLPDFAFKVRMNPAQAAQVAALPNVTWVGLFQPAYKLSPELQRDGVNLYRIRVERGANTGQVTAAIARNGIEVVRSQGNLLLVLADANQLEAIAQVLDVAWVENFVINQNHSEYGAGVILGANTANANGYNGSSQIAAVADTGLGGGTPATAHPDIPAGRITSIFDWPASRARGCYSVINDGAVDADSGHGTHVAVSVLGDGGAAGEGKGTAPAAGLVFQSIEDWVDMGGQCALLYPDGYYLLGLPDDLHNLYQQAYNAGARIHSNSWGSAAAGDYTIDSANSDDFIWANPDMTITFSAGNEGIDANADGVVDNDSTGSPATAKNVITVGASENDRNGNYNCDTGLSYQSRDAYQPNTTCSGMGGQNILGTYGSRWGADYPANPLFSDPTAGNKEQMASFSSRGPTDDGRIKPDVVAPGTWILAGYSSLYQEGYGDPTNPLNGAYQMDGWGMPANANYKYFGGTSMSNPITAGAATVVRDFYQKAHGHNASAALVKATLINSAVDMLDENNDGANDNDYPIPNVHEGWGRVNLAAATDDSHEFFDEATGVGTNGSKTYQFQVSGGAFKASLVWSDYASTETAAANLVNNLNLLVTAPGGAQYRGNVFNGGWSQTGGSADSVNNVENVYIQSAAGGTWTVQVSGFNVPNGPQPFALVVDYTAGNVDAPPSGSITNPLNGSTVSGQVAITADASDDNNVAQVEFFVDGVSLGADTNGGDGWSMAWDSATVADGSHTLSITVTDDASQTGSNSITVTVDNVNELPVAAFTVNCNGLACAVDASNSTDADGSITGYAWNFGDGNSSSGVTASHTYSGDGDYTITLTVTDNGGATATASQNVSVANTPPSASFTVSCTNLGCDFDASGSMDADGSITAYAWDFGDGNSGSGVTASHTYSADGDYTVSLTVTDDAGATAIDSQTVTVSQSSGGGSMHLGALSGNGVPPSKGKNWTADVVVTIHDVDHAPVANATVNGTWSNGTNGSGSCVTDGNGQCTISKSVKNNVAEVTFTVDSVTHATLVYDSNLNEASNFVVVAQP